MAEESYGPALAHLHAASFNPCWDAGMFAVYIGDSACTTLLAREHGTSQALGFVLARAAADEAEILTLAVAPRARCQGVGRTLLDRLAPRLAAAGIKSLFLEVGDNNHAAKALYRGAGFVEAGKRAG